MKRAHQAADWQQFMQEADVLPNLKWMPSTSPNPGADHMPFWGTILPIDDPFWDQHRPGDRWNCKCSLTSTDEPTTPVPSVAVSQQPKNTPQKGLENNPGKDAAIFSDKHPYIANAYPGAQEAAERAVKDLKEWDTDKTYYGNRLKISKRADKTELEENLRVAKNLLASFKDMTIKIREHVLTHGVPNPEYEINGLIADRKSIKSVKGVSSAFLKAIKQGCQTVVIDLDMRMKGKKLQTIKLSNKLYNRHLDFEEGIIKECYVIYRGKAVLIDAAQLILDDKEGSIKLIRETLEGLI